jgi:hypothetical protein
MEPESSNRSKSVDTHFQTFQNISECWDFEISLRHRADIVSESVVRRGASSLKACSANDNISNVSTGYRLEGIRSSDESGALLELDGAKQFDEDEMRRRTVAQTDSKGYQLEGPFRIPSIDR